MLLLVGNRTLQSLFSTMSKADGAPAFLVLSLHHHCKTCDLQNQMSVTADAKFLACEVLIILHISQEPAVSLLWWMIKKYFKILSSLHTFFQFFSLDHMCSSFHVVTHKGAAWLHIDLLWNHYRSDSHCLKANLDTAKREGTLRNPDFPIRKYCRPYAHCCPLWFSS